MGEALLSDEWAAYARYDRMRRDLLAGDEQTISGPAIGITYWPQTDVRLTAEAQFLDTTDQPNARSLTVDVTWIF